MASSNFKFEVPAAVQNAINALAMHVMENWDILIIIVECITSAEIVEFIHGNAYDGLKSPQQYKTGLMHWLCMSWKLGYTYLF